MRILIAGSSGLIGSELVPFLRDEGHTVHRLVRRYTKLSDDERSWDPEHKKLDPQILESYDAIINLAGTNIADSRWNDSIKKEILKSRVESTRLLTEVLTQLPKPPKVFISASAIGFYGDRGEDPATETTPSGKGFLAKVCREWEHAAEAAAKAGIRVVTPRIGVVLAAQGGAFKKMLMPFKLGVGGVIGTGNQYMSWVTLDDLLRIFHLILNDDNIKGPLNAVTSFPVTNREFTKTLGNVLNRPTLFTLPAFAVRMAFGEMADEMLLSGVKAVPVKLQKAGYTFLYPQLEPALKHLIS